MKRAICNRFKYKLILKLFVMICHELYYYSLNAPKFVKSNESEKILLNLFTLR